MNFIKTLFLIFAFAAVWILASFAINPKSASPAMVLGVTAILIQCLSEIRKWKGEQVGQRIGDDILEFKPIGGKQ